MPPENRRFLLPYGNMVFNSFGPRNAFFEAALADAEPVLAWVQAQSRRDALSDSGFGAAIHAAADDGDISVAEAEVLVRSLLTAGVDTTVNGLCAAVYCLARFPAVFAQLRADPSLARAGIRGSGATGKSGADVLPDLDTRCGDWGRNDPRGQQGADVPGRGQS
jgi:hypothetical protein